MILIVDDLASHAAEKFESVFVATDHVRRSKRSVLPFHVFVPGMGQDKHAQHQSGHFVEQQGHLPAVEGLVFDQFPQYRALWHETGERFHAFDQFSLPWGLTLRL
jgi:hypothetical protein